MKNFENDIVTLIEKVAQEKLKHDTESSPGDYLTHKLEDLEKQLYNTLDIYYDYNRENTETQPHRLH